LNENSLNLYHYKGDDNQFFNFTINIKDYDNILKSLKEQGIELNKEIKEYEFYTFSLKK
jgi:hypothetical protein